MDSIINHRTFARGLDGVANGGDFATCGGDFRSAQNASRLQWFMNSLANIITFGRYNTNTDVQIDEKTERLRVANAAVAMAILKLPSAIGEQTVTLQIAGKVETFTLATDNAGAVTVSHREHSQKLRGNLADVKRGMLANYLQTKRAEAPGAAIPLEGFDLTDVDLSATSGHETIDLSGCDFTNTTLVRTSFRGRKDLRGKNFARAEAAGADFSETNCYGADFKGAHMDSAKFTGATLNTADFSGASLVCADFTSAWLLCTKFVKHNNQTTDLTNAIFAGAHANEADFSDANATNAYMKRLEANKANFTNTNLSGANATLADFSSCTACRANFTGAKLSGINLENTDLRGANFTSTLSAKNVKLANARYLKSTFWDESVTLSNSSFVDPAKKSQIATKLNSGEPPEAVFFNPVNLALQHSLRLDEQVLKKYLEDEAINGNIPSQELRTSRYRQSGAKAYIDEASRSEQGLPEAVSRALIKLYIKESPDLRKQLLQLQMDWQNFSAAITEILMESPVPEDFNVPNYRVRISGSDDDDGESNVNDDNVFRDPTHDELVQWRRESYSSAIGAYVPKLTLALDTILREEGVAPVDSLGEPVVA